MQLNPAEISALIKERIQGFESSAQIRTQGSVVSVTDGICRVYGLSEAMQGEMLEFPGNVFGLALNLERDSVEAVILGEYTSISEGDPVKCTGVIWRKSVSEPVQTGLKAIDSMVPIGRGQRELIIGDRQTGKTAVAVDTIIHQKGKDLICIYVAIGQKASSMMNVVRKLEEHGALDYTI